MTNPSGFKRDAIYSDLYEEVSAFKFDQRVVDVFPDMIVRSVPAYHDIVRLTGLWAARYAQADSYCYDLGCSVGATTLSIRHGIRQPHCRIIAVDNARAMIEKMRLIVETDDKRTERPLPHVDVLEANIQDISIERASLVVLNFTLQFIPPAERTAMLEKIYAGLLPGGILILSEKVIFSEEEHGQRMIDVHHDFKRANGYSDLEVSQKRTSLENVLVPETVQAHLDRMLHSGFSSAEQWYQALNFVSLVGIKQAV